jgi:protease-4
VTERLFAKLQAEREVIFRGAAATLHADTARFSDKERAKIRAEIGAGYARFKSRVSAGRDLSEGEVEAVARGRVWTGEQARSRGLVDHLGDLHDAADHARELAGIPRRRYVPLQDIRAPRRYQPPLPWPADAADWISSFRSLLLEGLLAMAPWSLRIRG